MNDEMNRSRGLSKTIVIEFLDYAGNVEVVSQVGGGVNIIIKDNVSHNDIVITKEDLLNIIAIRKKTK